MPDSTGTPEAASPVREEDLPPRPGQVLLSAALQAANIGTWEYDVESGHFLFNDQYYRLHGLTAAQAGGYRMHASEFAAKWVHPEDAHTVAERIREAIEATDPSFQSRTEGRILRADGQPLWVVIWYRIEKDAGGRTVRLHGVNQDIHQRKLAEAGAAGARAELERSLRFTRSLLAAIPTPVFFKDAEGRYMGCNRAFTEVMGVTSEEIRGKTVHECWPSEHARVYHEHDLELMRDPKLQVYDSEVRDRNGERREVLFAKGVFRDESDRVAGIVGAFMDITERTRAEAELRYRSAFERVVTGISTRLVGCTPDEVDAGIDEALAAIGAFARVDRSYVFLFRDPPLLMDNTHEWCAEGVSHEIASLQGLAVESFPSVQVVREGRAYQVARVADLPDGSVERHEFEREGIQSLVLVPVQSAGRVLGFLGLDAVRSERIFTEGDIALLRVVGEIFANIIERQRAITAVAERERRLRFITDSMLDVVAQIDPDGRIEYVSPSVTRLLGYRPDEIVGRHGLELVHPDDAAGLLAAERAANDAGAPSSRVEYRFRHADGHHIWLESTVRIVSDEAGTLAGTVFTSRDISERKRIEEQLREAQKLESVGRLAAGVAHDFNNLLTPIMGYSDLLRYQLRDLPESRGLVEEISRAAARSRDLVRQLLAFSRKQILELQVVDLRQVVSEVERLLRRTLREDIELTIIASPEACQVRADVGQMEQVIMNLAVNAQDAMPDGGSLRIRSSVVELDASFCAGQTELKPGRHALLSVADSGHGMDAETRSHVFEPFFTTREVGKGTGLGLATVYGIVKQHGGTITVQSEPGQGATFDVYLPEAMARAAEPRKAARPALECRRNETVMVVEDDDMVRDLVVRVLEHLGCTVLAARSGRECLDLLGRHLGPLHLLLTDVVIPDLNGRELFEQVALAFPSVKAVFMSGHTRDIIAHRGVLEDGVCFLQKPFSVATLRARISEVLDRPPG